MKENEDKEREKERGEQIRSRDILAQVRRNMFN